DRDSNLTVPARWEDRNLRNYLTKPGIVGRRAARHALPVLLQDEAWSPRSCYEPHRYVCQTKLRKVPKSKTKDLHKRWMRMGKPNEITAPSVSREENDPRINDVTANPVLNPKSYDVRPSPLRLRPAARGKPNPHAQRPNELRKRSWPRPARRLTRLFPGYQWNRRDPEGSFRLNANLLQSGRTGLSPQKVKGLLARLQHVRDRQIARNKRIRNRSEWLVNKPKTMVQTHARTYTVDNNISALHPKTIVEEFDMMPPPPPIAVVRPRVPASGQSPPRGRPVDPPWTHAEKHAAMTDDIPENGRVFVFGGNAWGQLGLGHKDEVTRPSCVKWLKPHRAMFVACGRAHTVFVTDSNSVYSVGCNDEGQLGTGDMEHHTVPQYVEVEEHPNIRQVSAGSNHTALLTGDNENQKLGIPSTATTIYVPEVLPLDIPIKSACCGAAHTFLLSMDETKILAFGSNERGQLGLPQDVENMTQPMEIDMEKMFDGYQLKLVACGAMHTAFVTDNGLLYTCGESRHNKLCLEDNDDNSNETNQYSPKRVTAMNGFIVDNVACGGCHTLLTATKGSNADFTNNDFNLVTEETRQISLTELPPLKIPVKVDEHTMEDITNSNVHANVDNINGNADETGSIDSLEANVSGSHIVNINDLENDNGSTHGVEDLKDELDSTAPVLKTEVMEVIETMDTMVDHATEKIEGHVKETTADITKAANAAFEAATDTAHQKIEVVEDVIKKTEAKIAPGIDEVKKVLQIPDKIAEVANSPPPKSPILQELLHIPDLTQMSPNLSKHSDDGQKSENGQSENETIPCGSDKSSPQAGKVAKTQAVLPIVRSEDHIDNEEHNEESDVVVNKMDDKGRFARIFQNIRDKENSCMGKGKVIEEHVVENIHKGLDTAEESVHKALNAFLGKSESPILPRNQRLQVFWRGCLMRNSGGTSDALLVFASAVADPLNTQNSCWTAIMSVQTLLLDFSIDPARLGDESGQKAVFSQLETVLKDYVPNLILAAEVAVDGGSLKLLTGKKGTTVSVRLFDRGLVTVNIEYYKEESEEPLISFKSARVLESQVKKYISVTKSQAYAPIKRGLFSRYYPTSDERLLEYDIDNVVFDEQSPFQRVQIVHSKSLGNMLVLDDLQKNFKIQTIFLIDESKTLPLRRSERFSLEVRMICERMLREQEAALRAEYETALSSKLAEQYEAFLASPLTNDLVINFTVQRRPPPTTCMPHGMDAEHHMHQDLVPSCKQGFKEAALKFQQEAGLQEPALCSSLDERIMIREAVQNGRIPDAIAMLIRGGRAEEALSFASAALAEAGAADRTALTELERSLALLAFPDPHASPFADLLLPSHSQKIASELNAAILKMENQEYTNPKLCSLLRMILWSQNELDKHNIKYPKMTDLANATIEQPKL
ncbi:hypothetical protein MSG28_007770, partial [Choristoneura fumiferana]